MVTETSRPRSVDPRRWLAGRVEGRRVLEVSGSGDPVAPLLAGEDIEVTLALGEAERGEAMHRQVQAVPAGAGRRVELATGPIASLEPPQGGWDSVLLSGGLAAALDPSAILRAALRGLSTDPDRPARVLVSVPLGHGWEAASRKPLAAGWAFYPDDLLLLLAPSVVPEELDIQGGRILCSGTLRQGGEVPPLSALRAALGEERLIALTHDALEARERDLLQRLHRLEAAASRQDRGDVRSRAQNREQFTGAADGADRQQLLDALRVTQRALKKAEAKRAGHYEQLQRTRGLLDEKVERLREIYGSRRYRIGTVFAESAHSLVGLLLLPVRLLQVLWGGDGLLPWQRPKPRIAPDERKAKAAETSPDVDGEASAVGGEGGRSTPGRGAAWTAPGVPVLLPPAAPVHLHELRVAAILDEMSTASFAPECDLVTFTPDNWRRVLEERRPNLLLVESAWQGNGGSWQYKIGRYNHPDAGGLDELLAWFRQHGIPTVFWNKEDPVHFAKFRDAARKFDHVLTTDANVIERYEELPGSQIRSVAAMTFAAQPRLHNPVASGERSDAPCFAGSYYANRHIARRHKMEMLLDGARDLGLVIYDRNYGSGNEDFLFPERFRTHIAGRLPYDRVIDAYKGHKVFLNVNSVEDSPTMLSRRVFELLACGTAVVSTPSQALDNLFGDLVVTVESEEEAREAIRTLVEDDAVRRDLVRRGRRFVLSSHTYEQRLREVAEIAGFEGCAPRDRGVTVLLSDASEGSALRLLDLMQRQTLPVCKAVLGSHDPRILESLETVAEEVREGRFGDLDLRVVRQEAEAGEVAAFRRLAALATTPWVAILDTDAKDPELLRDLVLTTTYSRADVFAPPAAVGAPEQLYGGPVRPAPSLVRRDLVERHGWCLDPECHGRLLQDLEARGGLLYRVDRPAVTGS